MDKITLTNDLIRAIELILSKGNTAEVKKRKSEIIVLENEKHIKGNQPL